jgi:hypothetical protein
LKGEEGEEFTFLKENWLGPQRELLTLAMGVQFQVSFVNSFRFI